MQSREMESVRTKMESLRLMWEKDASLQQQYMESSSSSLHSLDSVKAKAEETITIQGEQLKVKSRLKEAEDELVKALAVKTRKEAKRMAALDAISAIKARVQELDQKAKRDDEYSSIISRQSSALAALEEKTEEESRKRAEIQEASAWYDKMLGLHVEAGRGVKFSFRNIDANRPDKLYSFTIRHANEEYSLLECDPPVDCIQELMHELNKSNDLFKFVRIMRRRFVEATEQGTSLQMRVAPQASSMIAVSAPSFSSDTSATESQRNGTPRSSSSIRRTRRSKRT